MNINEIMKRLAEIQNDIETRGESMTADELTALESEVSNLKAQRESIEANANARKSLLDDIASGRKGLNIPNPKETRSEEDPCGTMEYRRAFMEYCRSGKVSDILKRSGDAVTTSSDISAVVPTTILNEVIRKLGAYGQLFSRVRKTSVPGGMAVPILSLKPTASWIGETAASDRQKVEANTSVTFNYYGLECKISQSLISTLVGLPSFENTITELLYEAMVSALENGIVNGNGSGKMLGITQDSRIASGNKVSLGSSEISDWEAWKKKVFAKMPIRYKAGAVLIMASGTWEGYIDGMTDANGQPIARVNYGISEGSQERFAGKEVIQVEDDILKSYDDASSGDVIAIFMNLNDYCINSNMQLSMYRYKDEDKNEYIDKGILVCDGKILDPNGVILIKKG